MRKVACKPRARAVKSKAPRARPRFTEEEEDRLLAKAARKVLADEKTRWIPWSKVRKQLGLV